jgi:lysophospholipase L1-like esterase
VRNPRLGLGLRRAAAVAAVVTVGAGLTATPASASSDASKAKKFDYYLALGDSLGAGIQPGADGQNQISGKGYADDIAADLKKANPKLKFVDLACPGEDTTTMIKGSCPWPHPYKDQLGAATKFLKEHKGSRILVTVDIGANNVDGCAPSGSIDIACALGGLKQAATDVPRIMDELREAAGHKTEFIGMNYYNPFLAMWLTGPSGQLNAHVASAFLDAFNAVLTADFRAYGAKVADVAGAFSSDSFTPMVPIAPGVTVPLNVARICQWTWMCAPKPFGPNIHANTAGYQVLAQAFEAKI